MFNQTIDVSWLFRLLLQHIGIAFTQIVINKAARLQLEGFHITERVNGGRERNARKSRAVSGWRKKSLNSASCGVELCFLLMAFLHLLFECRDSTRHSTSVH